MESPYQCFIIMITIFCGGFIKNENQPLFTQFGIIKSQKVYDVKASVHNAPDCVCLSTANCFFPNIVTEYISLLLYLTLPYYRGWGVVPADIARRFDDAGNSIPLNVHRLKGPASNAGVRHRFDR